MKYGSCTDMVMGLTPNETAHAEITVLRCSGQENYLDKCMTKVVVIGNFTTFTLFSSMSWINMSVLPGCDGSTICWSWAGGDSGGWRSSLWVIYRLFSSAERGCCWAGRLSWAWGSTGASRGPKSASRACSLRDGLWKQKQNMSSGMRTCRDSGNLKDVPEFAWKKVFSESHAAGESWKVL